MIGTFIQPNENAVVATASVVVQIRVTPDVGKATTGAVMVVNGGSPLGMTFDSALNVWKKSIAVAQGPLQIRVDVTDNTPATASFYLNFSASGSVAAPPIIIITNPLNNAVLATPGMTVQADVTREATISRVEVSTDKGATWKAMSIPAFLGAT